MFDHSVKARYLVLLVAFTLGCSTAVAAQIRGIGLEVGAGKGSLRLGYVARDGERQSAWTLDAKKERESAPIAGFTRCVLSAPGTPGCESALDAMELSASDVPRPFAKWKRKLNERRRIRLDEIQFHLDNGLAVGLQSYYESVEKRRVDLGLRGSMGDTAMRFTLTRPGVQLSREFSGFDVHMRLGAESDQSAGFVLGLRRRW